MRITESQLRRIIREEARRLGARSINEGVFTSGVWVPDDQGDDSPESRIAAKHFGVPYSQLLVTDGDMLSDSGIDEETMFVPDGGKVGRKAVTGTIEGKPALSVNAGGLNVYFVVSTGLGKKVKSPNRFWAPAMDERSDMMNMAMMDEDPNAVPNYKKELGKIAGMLGTSADALMALADDPDADSAFKPTRGARAQTLRSKNSYGDEWIKMATMGILDGETVLQVHDTDSDMKTYYK